MADNGAAVACDVGKTGLGETSGGMRSALARYGSWTPWWREYLEVMIQCSAHQQKRRPLRGIAWLFLSFEDTLVQRQQMVTAELDQRIPDGEGTGFGGNLDLFVVNS